MYTSQWGPVVPVNSGVLTGSESLQICSADKTTRTSEKKKLFCIWRALSGRSTTSFTVFPVLKTDSAAFLKGKECERPAEDAIFEFYDLEFVKNEGELQFSGLRLCSFLSWKKSGMSTRMS